MTTPLYPEQPLLLVDDEQSWLDGLSLTLKQLARINHVVPCTNSLKVLELLNQQTFSMIVLDLTMPELSGQQLLSLLQEHFPQLPVVVISGMNQMATAVECMKLGAFDYYVKTDDRERLVAGICRALEHQQLKAENQKLAELVLNGQLNNPESFAEIITCSEVMRSIFRYLEAIAPSPEPLLICGESGVGKELVAKAVHRLSCPHQPWVAVNVAGLDDTVFADTLFGHKRGAFTGADQERRGMIAAAGEGVLFLDEIGDLSPASQIKLLRLLQEREYFPIGSDQPCKTMARIIVATNHDLSQQEVRGLFRRDLLYRLATHRVQVPPLREHLEDLPLLLDHFLAEAASVLGKKCPSYPEQLPVLLATYPFPGNIRELRSMIYDALSQHHSHILSMDSFKRVLKPNILAGTGQTKQQGSDSKQTVIFPQTLPPLSDVGNLLVKEALRRTEGNRSLAATLLGVSHQALSKRLRKISSS